MVINVIYDLGISLLSIIFDIFLFLYISKINISSKKDYIFLIAMSVVVLVVNVYGRFFSNIASLIEPFIFLLVFW
ncbi:hypothetical protein [Lactobacillus ultunensis]|uniref:hypothetical protein n=1 Tax=Lactobacillus ultunensis TaxID=227945 RepID=UPI00058B2A97|nr:hypothetical protein [Lactobacillus ultunensis]QQP28374.1 hypothetical protein H4B44_09830 [Lactobacillus ultunensis]